MTTPGGVPNLPPGALTLDTLKSSTQDMSGTAMKARAAARFPAIMDSSTGLSPLSDLTPFGILTRLWAEFNAAVANADPADIDSPEDLPGLLLQFIEGLPVVGQFVGLLEAILGTYDGDDEALLTVQRLFAILWSILGDLNPLDPDFDPLGAWTKIWQLLIMPGGLAVSASDVIGNLIDDSLVIPFTIGGDGGPVQQWFIDIPQAIEGIILQFVTAFARADPTGITGRFAEGLQQLFDIANGIFTRSKTHSANLAVLNSRVFGDTDANAITFAFSGASTPLTTLGWTLINAGATGMDFTQHDDYLQMTGSAGADATLIAIYDSPDPAEHFTSHIQSCTYYPREQIASSGQTALEMPLRVNNATTLSTLRCCYARVARGGSGGTVDFVILIDGVATDLADIPGVDPDLVSASGLKFAATDQFDFVLGDPDADPLLQADQYNWRWRWYLNTILILDTVYNPVPWNAAAADLLDETIYNCPSFGMTADFIFIFLPAMVPPTTLDQLSYYTPGAAA